MEPLIFKPIEVDGKTCYHETTISIGEPNFTTLSMLDLFFRPKEKLGEETFGKIFPKELDVQKNHEMILKNREYFPWNGWMFRGHTKSSYHLQTSFERLCMNKPLEQDLFSMELGIIRNFKRTVRGFFPELSAVNDKDTYEFMAWLQHFGGATRFLDVSYSFFVALYFAIWHTSFFDKSESVRGECSVWCFNRMWMEKKYKKFLPKEILKLYENYDMFGKDIKIQEAILDYVPMRKKNGDDISNTFLSVINMEPYYKNPRMERQKGLFMMPTNPYQSFEKNLFNMVEDDDDSWRILKINIEYDNDSIRSIQKALDDMNINRFVLFEDLEGLCVNNNAKTRLPNDSLMVSPNASIFYPNGEMR